MLKEAADTYRYRTCLFLRKTLDYNKVAFFFSHFLHSFNTSSLHDTKKIPS